MKAPIIKSIGVLLILTIIPLGACKKNDDPIPNVYVNFSINILNTQYADLNAVGGWVYVTGGVKGIVIYRKSFDEFMAYERNCPYKPSDPCSRISVENTALTVIDSCCGSRFLLLDGSVVNGPATLSLKAYQTYFDGEKLYVNN